MPRSPPAPLLSPRPHQDFFCFIPSTYAKDQPLTEHSQSYEVLTDPYHNIPRLNLHQFDGSVMQPLYLVYSPPQMLPTITLNPTVAVAGATTTSNAKARKVRRALGLDREVPANLKGGRVGSVVQKVDTDRFWWIGLGMTGIGGLLYFGPRRMGVQL